jgi:hypothetical protein
MHIYCHFESGSCYFITILVLNALGRRSVTGSFTASVWKRGCDDSLFNVVCCHGGEGPVHG